MLFSFLLQRQSDNSWPDTKQIVPELQIKASRDVKEQSHSLPLFQTLSLFLLRLSVILLFPFVHFSEAKPQQLWEISASCQHFDLIVECVNQAGGRWTKSNSTVTRYFGSLRALSWGINFDCRTEPRTSASDLCSFHSANSTWRHILCKDICSGSLWIIFLLALAACLGCMAASKKILFKVEHLSEFKHRHVQPFVTQSPLWIICGGGSAGSRGKVQISVKHQVGVTNRTWILLVHLVRTPSKRLWLALPCVSFQADTRETCLADGFCFSLIVLKWWET